MARRWRPVLAAYRMVSQLIDPQLLYAGLRGYPRYLQDFLRYRRLTTSSGQKPAMEWMPALRERTLSTTFDAHYCYMSHWATKGIVARFAASGAARHVDVGSQIAWLMPLAALLPVETVDIRPYETCLPWLTVRAGSILSLPYADRSIASLSCLHVVEHIGLGRYGDPLSATGSVDAMRELARVLAGGGSLHFAVPCGRPRVCFNAHRVFDPLQIVSAFEQWGLHLETFSAVTDERRYLEPARPEVLVDADYGCGMFHFRRDER